MSGQQDRYVFPADVGALSPAERVAWLRKDVEDSDGYSGVPRFVPRYSERESEIVHTMGLVLDELRGAVDRLLDAMWTEFGDQLLLDEDSIDRAYLAGCKEIGKAPDPRTPAHSEEARP